MQEATFLSLDRSSVSNCNSDPDHIPTLKEHAGEHKCLVHYHRIVHPLLQSSKEGGAFPEMSSYRHGGAQVRSLDASLDHDLI